jgi:hypothetical protein
VEIEKCLGLVLGEGGTDGVVDGGEGGVIVVVVLKWRRCVGRGALLRGVVEGGAEAGVGGVAVCLRRGGVAFCLSRSGEGSSAGSLKGVVGRGCDGPTIQMKAGGG